MSEVVPSGTVTFMFTDVEGSTALWEREPQLMAEALARHDNVVREAVVAHGGYVFSTGGDGFAVAFGRARDAVSAAVALQRALLVERSPDGVRLRVRIGLHTGEAIERDGDYFGSSVNRAARLMSLAAGGEVFVSSSTAELVRDRLPDGVQLLEVGELALRGLDRPEQAFALVGDGLAELPSGGSRQRRPGNLTGSATSFIGRVDDIQQLVMVLRERRIVTLVGVGGVGKTRLALEIASQLADEFADGAWFCELAPVNADSVAPLLLSMLGLRVQQERSPVESVIDGLTDRRLLLVLDNCEHLLETVAELVAGLGALCASVTVLATSREPLGVAGERVWPLRSLDPVREGAELFLERARDVGASLGEQRHEIELLCARLDGIPLAIELAAVRTRTMDVGEILEHLGQRFKLLRGASRGRVERHQTLHAMVRWSYDLLSEDERTLFDRLSVFAGAFDAEAVTAVCLPGADELDVLDRLGALVNRSMLTVEHSASGSGYRLLETLRQYGAGNLTDDATFEVRGRHTEHYASVAERAGRLWNHDAYRDGERLFAFHWDNIRLAVGWALTNDNFEPCASVLRAVTLYSAAHLLWETGDWAVEALERGATTPIFGAHATPFAGLKGDFAEQVRLGEATLASASSSDDPDLYLAWGGLVGGYSRTGAGDKLPDAVEHAYRFAQRLNPAVDAYWAIISAYFVAATDDEADKLVARADTLARTTGNAYVRAHVLTYHALLEIKRHHFDRAMRLCDEGLEIAEAENLPWSISQAWATRIMVATSNPQPSDAPIFVNGLQAMYAHRSWFDLWPALAGLAVWWASQGALNDAAVMVGHFDAHELVGIFAARGLPDVSSQTTGTEHAEARSVGARLDRDALVRHALTRLRAATA